MINSRLQASTIIKQAEQQSFVRAETIVEEGKLKHKIFLHKSKTKLLLQKKKH